MLSCADSRVPVELIFDQTIGHIFVTRVAGNILNSEIIGSLEYGVEVLGVKALLVIGHSNCGAVKVALKKDAVPGQIASLYPHLQPAVESGGGDLEETKVVFGKKSLWNYRGMQVVFDDGRVSDVKF